MKRRITHAAPAIALLCLLATRVQADGKTTTPQQLHRTLNRLAGKFDNFRNDAERQSQNELLIKAINQETDGLKLHVETRIARIESKKEQVTLFFNYDPKRLWTTTEAAPIGITRIKSVTLNIPLSDAAAIKPNTKTVLQAQISHIPKSRLIPIDNPAEGKTLYVITSHSSNKRSLGYYTTKLLTIRIDGDSYTIPQK